MKKHKITITNKSITKLLKGKTVKVYTLKKTVSKSIKTYNNKIDNQNNTDNKDSNNNKNDSNNSNNNNSNEGSSVVVKTGTNEEGKSAGKQFAQDNSASYSSGNNLNKDNKTFDGKTDDYINAFVDAYNNQANETKAIADGKNDGYLAAENATEYKSDFSDVEDWDSQSENYQDAYITAYNNRVDENNNVNEAK